MPPASSSILSPPGHHRHGDEVHADGHAHPHQHAAPGEPPIIGIVGGGAVGTALGVALTRAGWPVHAVASRDPDRRDRFRSAVEGARGFAEPQALIEEVELIILAVPDDALEPLAGTLRLYSGQAMIHTSGALGADVLAPAQAAGTQVGAFHPLVAFADTERAVAALHGATIAIEGDDQLAAPARRHGRGARRDGGPPRAGLQGRLPRRGRAGRGWLRGAARRDRRAGPGGRPRRGRARWPSTAPLIEGTLGNARALGIRAALTGPITRGDIGTLDAHLAALRAHAPGVLELYRGRGPTRGRPRGGPWRAGTGDRRATASDAGDDACAGRLNALP